MNRIILVVAAFALAPAASGQLYKYVDKDGKTVYSDQPPGNVDSKVLKAPPPPPAAETKPAAERDKEAPKAPREARDTARAPERTPPSAAEKEERCQAARQNYAIFFDPPVMMRNTVTGERFQLDEKQAEAEKAKAKTAMEAACKKPPE